MKSTGPAAWSKMSGAKRNKNCELVCDKVAREHPKNAMLGMIDNLALAQRIKPSLNLHLEFLPSTEINEIEDCYCGERRIARNVPFGSLADDGNCQRYRLGDLRGRLCDLAFWLLERRPRPSS